MQMQMQLQCNVFGIDCVLGLCGQLWLGRALPVVVLSKAACQGSSQ